MDQNERGIIDDLFARLDEAERRAGPRDAEAERLIRGHLTRQPAAPYYMAQAIVAQQEALARAQTRIEQLERQGGARRRLPRRPVRRRAHHAGARDGAAAEPPRAAPGRSPPAPAAASSPARRRPRSASRAAC